jgi:hypothetical protein
MSIKTKANDQDTEKLSMAQQFARVLAITLVLICLAGITVKILFF